MRFVLQSSGQEIHLPEGRFVIGRAETCQLALDDPLVSRNHAALVVTPETVTLEDLGSRNGVKVNGERVEGRRLLALGDTLGIGAREFKLGKRTDLTGETLVQVPTQRMPPFGLMGMLADKALALGRGDEAERLLTPQLSSSSVISWRVAVRRWRWSDRRATTRSRSPRRPALPAGSTSCFACTRRSRLRVRKTSSTGCTRSFAR
jgi:pSer/pThr/pTyr-binding forkhead associated (FHA) protein